MHKLFIYSFLLTNFLTPLLSFSSDCKTEQEKFCKAITHPKAKITQCLLEHKGDLSDACKSGIKAYSEKLQQKAKQACEADVDKYCKWVIPGGGRIIKCLFKNENSLSDSCKKVLYE